MKAGFSFSAGAIKTVANLLEALNGAFSAFGANTITCFRPRQGIAVSETPIAHTLGAVPSGWRHYSMETAGAVLYQTRPPDERFVYLAANVACVTGVEIF